MKGQDKIFCMLCAVKGDQVLAVRSIDGDDLCQFHFADAGYKETEGKVLSQPVLSAVTQAPRNLCVVCKEIAVRSDNKTKTCQNCKKAQARRLNASATHRSIDTEGGIVTEYVRAHSKHIDAATVDESPDTPDEKFASQKKLTQPARSKIKLTCVVCKSNPVRRSNKTQTCSTCKVAAYDRKMAEKHAAHAAHKAASLPVHVVGFSSSSARLAAPSAAELGRVGKLIVHRESGVTSNVSGFATKVISHDQYVALMGRLPATSPEIQKILGDAKSLKAGEHLVITPPKSVKNIKPFRDRVARHLRLNKIPSTIAMNRTVGVVVVSRA